MLMPAVSSSMFPLTNMKFVALLLVFTFCQVLGTMCVLPDLSWADDVASLLEERMACPMDGTIMCPPAATSSPERQAKHTAGVDLEHTSVPPGAVTTLTAATIPTPWSWSSAYSIVPISIASSSVLRI